MGIFPIGTFSCFRCRVTNSCRAAEREILRGPFSPHKLRIIGRSWCFRYNIVDPIYLLGNRHFLSIHPNWFRIPTLIRTAVSSWRRPNVGESHALFRTFLGSTRGRPYASTFYRDKVPEVYLICSFLFFFSSNHTFIYLSLSVVDLTTTKIKFRQRKFITNSRKAVSRSKLLKRESINRKTLQMYAVK